ncbi:hypothetical protein AAHC03_09843 [Spirometra sp. Aus1]
MSRDPPPGICVTPDAEDLKRIYALITGPIDTPYEGGFFLFLLVCPPDYPNSPPKVKLLTTGNGTVRFNPNLYANGKVCLSILGTWTGPEWTPAQSLSSVLISIQSLMNQEPYYNEPGFSTERFPGDSKRYNDIIRHETLRCAVCDVLERKFYIPDELYVVASEAFKDYYQHFESICEANLNYSGQQMNDPFGERRGIFQYHNVLQRLRALKASSAA